jgi:hypothetical protein
MLQDLIKSTCSSESTENEEDDDFTQTIALVGKARATAGALNLLRILIHFVLAHNSKHLEQVFVYRNRDITERHAANRMAGHDLCHASLAFVSSMSRASWQRVPELYDATHQTLQLVLVLCSTQLYQPMISSAQRRQQQQQQHLANQSANYFMDYILKQAQKRHAELQHKPIAFYESALGEPTPPAVSQDVLLLDSWTPASVLEACLSWQLNRPAAPERSIAHHYAQLATSVVQSKEKQVGPDGMYESHFVVMASRPKPPTKSKSPNSASSSTSTTHLSAYGKPPSQLILDVTRGVLILSSSLILLPFRFLSLALGLWHHHSNRDDDSHDAVRKRHLQSTVKSRGRTNDVLWLSDSPIADLASVLLLLLVHNYRAPPRNDGRKQGNQVEFNPFRVELAQLGDERWEAGALDPIPDEGHDDPFASFPVTNGDNSQYASFVNSEESVSLSKPLLRTNGATSTMTRPQHLTTNFESLLESFGDTVHTEVGALMLYTILQSSPTFASFIVVRSDLDTVVMPLLRTLYFSSALKHYSPHGISSSKNNARDNTALQLKSCPFRSPSQLYVILILLLLFSQDASFGPDAFRRIIVPSVPWYKERQLVNINLGSVLLLVLLRSITFNLNKLQDAFLLSNCCAVLMNLSHNIVELHDYAAMRLVSVAVSTLKRYSLLWSKNGNHASDDHDITTPVGMYGEVSHTLLRVLRHCIDSQHIERNLHLVYALVYHQSDFNTIASKKRTRAFTVSGGWSVVFVALSLTFRLLLYAPQLAHLKMLNLRVSRQSLVQRLL